MWGYVFVFMVKGRFFYNVGGVVFVGGKLGFVNIFVVYCDFINNSFLLSGGVMLVESSCKFYL